MNNEESSSCSCSYDCDCASPTISRKNAGAHEMASLNNSGKEDSGHTDAEDNQQSEGDSRKRSNSGSPARTKVEKNSDGDPENHKSIKRRPEIENLQRKPKSASSPKIILDSSHEVKGRKHLLALQGPDVHQSHSHRRHYQYHFQDNFSSNHSFRHHHHQHQERRHHKKIAHKDIVPTLDSCEYKDTNFLTQGSPPRSRTFRKNLRSRTSPSNDENLSSNNADLPNQQEKKYLAASFWKESDEQWSSNLHHKNREENSPGDNGKSADYLNKYKNESVVGPQIRTSNGKSNVYLLSNRLMASNKNQGGSADVSLVKPLAKTWRESDSTRGRQNSPVKKPYKRRDLSMKTVSSRAKELKKSEQHQNEGSSSIFTACIPSVSAFKKSNGQSRAKKAVCKVCMDRQTNTSNASVQTDMKKDEDKITQESQTEQNTAVEAVIKPAVADLSLYAGPPPFFESSESNSITTDGTSSLTFDDDYMVNFSGPDRPLEKCSRSDLLSRISQIQSDVDQLRCDTASPLSEDKQILDKTIYTRNFLVDLNDIVSEIYELYDDFDTDEKDEQSEFNELKKQLQQYKRRCRILEYELMSADVKCTDGEVHELQEEIQLCRHVAVSLHWELQAADEKLKKAVCENDQFRQRLAASEIQRSVLEKEVISLRNSVDQMSLHASSVPTNEREAIRSRDSVPELHRQIQFQNEERKAILTKLVETDKEKGHLEGQLQLYWGKYGEINVADRGVSEEEAKINELKIRIRMAEDQAGMLGRRVMQLQIDNENMAKQLSEKTKATTPDFSRKPSSSDFQFLEDEVEALRMTLEEVEEENTSLRYKLNQSKEQNFQNEKRLQIIQATQTSLRGLMTPTTSDKIAAWDAACRSTATTPTLKTESDITTPGIEFAPVLTAIDAATQTYNPTPFQVPKLGSEGLELVKKESGFERPVGLAKEVIEVLKKSEEIDVDFLVSQLTSLAIATRHLVDETPSPMKSMDQITCGVENPSNDITPTPVERPLCLPLRQKRMKTEDEEKTPRTTLSILHFLIFSILVYIVVSSLEMTSLIKFVLLATLFFLI